jgi:multiple sugar transport system substrate-binding protein
MSVFGRSKVARWVVSSCAIVLIATACTFGEKSNDGSGASGSGPVTLTMWAHRSKSFDKALVDAATAYHELHPDVTINLETFAYDDYIQTLQTALPAGNGADILHMFGTWTCTYSDFLDTVPTDVETLSDAKKAFYPGPLGGYVCGGNKLYGLPQESNVEYGAILVNTQMAQAAGTSTTGWDNWDDLIADAVKLTVVQDGKITRAGYHFTAGDGLAHSFLSLILQAGGNYMNADGTAFTFATPEGERSLGLLKSIVDAGAIDPVLFNDESNWVGDCYFTQLCAMGLVGPWAVADYEDDYPEIVANTVYAKLPPLEKSSEFVADSGWGLTVSNESPNAAIAWDFARFATLEAEQAKNFNLTSGTLPALKENAQGSAKQELIQEFPHFKTWFEVLPNARFVGQLPDRDKLYYDIIYKHGLAALRGDEAIPDALKAMETEANETFNE